VNAETRAIRLIAALALVVAACPAEDPDIAAPPDPDVEVPDEEFPDLTGQSVEVAAIWTGGEEESFREVLDAFSTETGADVTYTSTGDDIAAVLGTRVEGGQPPDVAMLPQPGLMTDFARDGALVSIEDVAGDLVDQFYADVWRDLGTVDDTLYGVYFKAANKSTVWYNVPLFEEAGVEIPGTWDEMLQVAETFVAFGFPGVAVGGADGWTLTDWFENIYLQQAGPELYDQLTNYEIPWTDESVIQALETFAEVLDPDFTANEPLNVTFPDSVSLVFRDEPEAAMVYEGDFVAGIIDGETPYEVGIDADFFPFPGIDGVEPGSHIVAAGDNAVLMLSAFGAVARITRAPPSFCNSVTASCASASM
jgi:alpha-glucoside transport system substrate-binding protein